VVQIPYREGVASAIVDPGQATGFEWDDANDEHLAEYGIAADEVEEIFDNRRCGSRTSGAEVAID
jgi:hypothetical protein